jgi:hypothetical protein
MPDDKNLIDATPSDVGPETVEREPAEIAYDRAQIEASRQAAHGDAFIVKTDLEDDDQRSAAPGTREQP